MTGIGIYLLSILFVYYSLSVYIYYRYYLCIILYYYYHYENRTSTSVKYYILNILFKEDVYLKHFQYLFFFNTKCIHNNLKRMVLTRYVGP